MTPVANLTIHSTDRKHVGTYRLVLTERSQLDSSVSFETQLTVIVEDYCLAAKLDLSLESREISFTPLPDQNLTVTYDLNDIYRRFTVDSEHRDFCTPVVFSSRL